MKSRTEIIVFILLIVFSLTLFSWAGYCQNEKVYIDELGQEWTLEICLDWLSKLQSMKQELCPSFSELLIFAKAANVYESDSLINVLITFPVYAPEAGATKMAALSLLDVKYRNRIRKVVMEALESEFQKVRESAAYVLVSWGEWKLAEPYIETGEAFMRIENLDDSLLAPALVKIKLFALDSKKDPHTRMCAAYFLRRKGNDENTIRFTALDILKNASVSDTNINSVRGYYTAMRYTASKLIPSSVKNIEMLAYHKDSFIFREALNSLTYMAEKGVMEAEHALYNIRENHPDPRMRSEAGRAIP